MKNTPSASTPETKDAASRALPRRKLDATTITEIAKLVARGLTESESCRQLEINPAKWFDWKSRCNREQKFGDKLEKLRAVRLDWLLDQVEKSAAGEGLKMRDWRASKFLLEVLDRRRFNTDKPVVELNVNQPWHKISEKRMREIEAMVEASHPKIQSKAAPAQIQDAQIVSSDESPA